jgi:succinate-acetate transporter protein
MMTDYSGNGVNEMNDVVIEKNRERLERETWTKAGPIVTRMPDDEVLALEERAMATVGDPSPMGLWAFATGTWIVGTVIGGAFGAPAAATTQAAAAPVVNIFTAVVPVLLFFTGVAQFIAGLFAYRRASPLMATAFCCFGAFAVSAAFAFLLQAWGLLPTPMAGSSQVLLGFLYESFGFIAFALALAAMGVNTTTVLWLATLCVGFVLAGIPNLAEAQTGGWMVIGNIGGWFLVASAFFAYYLGMALIVNSCSRRVVMGIGGKPC